MFDSVNFIACYYEICKGVTFIGTQCMYVFILQQEKTHKTSCQKDSKAQRRLQLPATKISRTNISKNLQYERNY